MIARPDVGQAVLGMGGLPVQGHLFPPTKFDGIPASTRENIAAISSKGRKLAISNPILGQMDDKNPLQKIPTIDLVTAAQNQRGKRVLPSNLQVEDGGAHIESVDVTDRGAQLGLEPVPMATTTSAQLSPGVEEIRRRSPGRAPQEFHRSSLPPKLVRESQVRSSSSRVIPELPLARAEEPSSVAMAPKVASNDRSMDLRMSVLPRSASVKHDIRPSRQLPRSLPIEENVRFETTTTLTSRKSGLPRNPKSSTTIHLGHGEAMIVEKKGLAYESVKNIYGKGKLGVEETTTKQDSRSSNGNLLRTTSMVHRPRPIPRKPVFNRSISLPKRPSNLHQRRRSLSDDSTWRSLPKTGYAAAGTGEKPRLKDTGRLALIRSKSAKSLKKTLKRVSQIPDLSSTLSKSLHGKTSFLPETRLIQIAFEDKPSDSTLETVPNHGTQSTQDNALKNGNLTAHGDFDWLVIGNDARLVSKFSISTAPSTGGEWTLQSPQPMPKREPSGTSIKRRSSPVLPAHDLSYYSDDEDGHNGEALVDWKSLPPTSVAPDAEKATMFKTPTKAARDKLQHDEDDVNMVNESLIGKQKDEETMTIMLDLSTQAPLEPGLDFQQRNLSRLHDEARQQQWHHRVGDVCPSFSDRRKAARRRNLPPPTPLLLGRPSQVRIIQAEPSPLESPRHVLQAIEEQLRKLEDRGLETSSNEQQRLTLLAHLEMEMGAQETQWKQMRHTLISRDSLSTLEASPRLDSQPGGVGNSATIESGKRLLNTLFIEDGISRPPSPCLEVSDHLHSVPSWALNNNNHSDDFTQDLDKVEAEQRDQTPAVPFHIRDSMGFRIVPSSSFPTANPTPPSTDASDNEYDDEAEAGSQEKGKTEIGITGLWRAIASDTLDMGITRAFLWTASTHALVQPQNVDLVETPRRLKCRQARKDLEPLQIESSQLWTKEKPIAKGQHSAGLWQSAAHFQKINPGPSAEKMVLRSSGPVTKRPARRSKRVTLLPDILENPKPLPHKRGSLGIFLLPGGGVSDIATVQPGSQRLRLQHMAGTMTSGGVPITSATMDAPASTPVPVRVPVAGLVTTFGHGLPPANASPPSFFDDCDSESHGTHADKAEQEGTDTDTDRADDGDEYYFDEYYSNEQDDDFDETTIWEIASLLRFSNFPARDEVFIPTPDEPHQKYQQSGQLGNSSGHEDGLNPVNAGSGLPTDDELAELHVGDVGEKVCVGVCVSVSDKEARDREPWEYREHREHREHNRGRHSDYQDCCCANPSVLEITNSFPSPPRRSAPVATNDDAYHDQAKATLNPCQTRQGNLYRLNKGLQKGTFPATGLAEEVPEAPGRVSLTGNLTGSLMQLDERMRRTYLNLVSATDTSRRPRHKAELVEDMDTVTTGTPTTTGDTAEGVVPSVSISKAEKLAFCICPPAPMPLNRVAPSAPPGDNGEWNCSVGFDQQQRERERQPVELLWTRCPVKTPPAKGLAQPDDQVWRVYQSISTSTSAQDSRRIQNQRLDLPTISSSSLWSLQQPKPKDDFSRQSHRLWNPSTSSTLTSTPSSTDSMALWSPTAPLPICHKGFAQPDTTTWNSYVSKVSDAVRALPRKSEPASIESKSLWTPSSTKAKVEAQPQSGLWGSKSQKQTSSTPGMWVQPPKVEKVSYGLPQPEEHIWATYLPAKENGLRVKLRSAIPATIESSQMWSPPPKTMIAESDELLWSKPRIITISTDASTTSLPLQKAVNLENFGLWTAPAAIIEEEPQGLFSLSHKRSDYRSTSLEPAALHMQRRPRAALEPYADFVFAHLWNEAPLWRGPKPVVQEQAEGLFSLGHIRTTYRTTLEPPAGLDMIRKPRVSNEPLPKLTSNSLWSLPTMPTTPVEIDWLRMSTVGPKKAPSIASIISENESLITEASSVDTDAASVKSFILEDHLAQFDATPLQWDDDSSVVSSTMKSGLWAKPASSKSPSSSAQAASMWRPASPDLLDDEPEYTIAETDEERSATFRYRRKSDDEAPSKNISPSNFLLLSDPEMPRDFSAQGLWSQLDEYAVEEKTWMDESTVRMTNRWLALS